MEVKKQSLVSKAYERVQQSFFDIMLDLLREKVTGKRHKEGIMSSCRSTDGMLLDVCNVLADRLAAIRCQCKL